MVKNKSIISHYYYFLLCIFLLLMSSLSYASSTLILGIFPRYNTEQTIHMFKPFAEYLAHHLQQPVKLVTSKNFESFLWKLESNQFDIVHLNQYQYLFAHKKYNYDAILRNEYKGKSSINSTFFVRKDSGISSIKQLKGKSIMLAGNFSAMMGSVVPQYLLLDAGLKHDDYQVIYAKNPPNALLAFYFGGGDMVAVGTEVIEMPKIKQHVDPEQLVIIAQSKYIAHLPWAVKGSMSASLKKQIQTIFSDLFKSAEGKKMLAVANLTKLVKTKDADYDEHRKIVAKVLGEFY